MSIGKKIAHNAESAKGSVKRAVGRAVGNRRLETEGRMDQVKGGVKQAGDKLKQAFGK